MFKKIFIKSIISILFFQAINVFSQQIDSSNIEVKYKTTFLIDTANIYTKKEEITSLQIGKFSSLFKSNIKQLADSLSREYIKKSVDNPVNGKVVIKTGNLTYVEFIPEVFFTNSKFIIWDKILRNTYSFETNEKIQWNLINETKVISGYKCQKATGKYRNKEITAWYTKDIPIPEGPYTFKGLPGLVLEAYDSKDYFHFTLAGLKNVRKPILPIEGGIKTTYEKFFKKRKEIMDDPLGSFFNSFGRSAPKDSEELIIKNIRSINNFLD
ncbi:GLPGLI family protein [Chryseobacterium sp. C-71]|uniref:GLPGLI family protein n=1 Tax=Chryseobacterium sp. C-71 TaxID=2893882 RepID=UPI001E42F72F|nr:GLPGLI family protein [Chryseobacterium sp. C-71]UFH31470.1 GLPGLI family protein [Chryseobacterium sp. C-71]